MLCTVDVRSVLSLMEQIARGRDDRKTGGVGRHTEPEEEELGGGGEGAGGARGDEDLGGEVAPAQPLGGEG